MSQSAGPPTRNVVNGASGTRLRTRSAPNAARSDSTAAIITTSGRSRAISARSRAISAAIASCGEHTTNEIVSPGPS